MFGVPVFQESPEVVGDREGSAFTVLRRPRVEMDLAFIEINLTPFEWCNLGNESPAGDVGKFEQGLQVGRQVSVDRFELFRLEEADPRVLFL